MVRDMNTGDAVCVQRSITTSEAFLITTLPLIGCHGQLTIACSTNHPAPCRTYCQPDKKLLRKQLAKISEICSEISKTQQFAENFKKHPKSCKAQLA